MRLAATVMLVRRAAPYEVLMVRRSEASRFVPNAYVFPGGTLAQSDLSERALARLRGASVQDIQEQFRARSAPGLPYVPAASEEEAAGLLFTAIRELFEESGVLLACDARGNVPKSKPLAGRQSHFLEFLEANDLYADARALTLFSQWLTPAQLPRRYNTHFFLARAGKGTSAAADMSETHDEIWIAPADALARHAAGEMHLVYPTIKHLERLAAFTGIDELFEFARTKPILGITPNPEGDDFTLPPELEAVW